MAQTFRRERLQTPKQEEISPPKLANPKRSFSTAELKERFRREASGRWQTPKQEEIPPPKLTKRLKAKSTKKELPPGEVKQEDVSAWAKHEDDPSADAIGSAWVKDENEHEDPSEIGIAGDSVAKRGFRDLRPEEKSRLLTVPECIMKEIGMQNLNPALSRAHPTPYLMLKHFFHRYLQLDEVDIYIKVEQIEQPRQRMYIAKVITPSFYNRTFWGEPRPRRKLAEDSAYLACLQDEEIVEAALNLPPHNGKVKRHVTNMLVGPWKKEMQARGIDPKLVKEEVVQKLFDIFQNLGCRCALWDGNA